MLEKLKGLTQQTLTYGIGNILVRMITFLLLPIYTNVLDQAEYGVAVLILIFIAFFNHIYRYGIDSAVLKFYKSADSSKEKSEILSTGFYQTLLTSFILSLAIYLLHEPLGNFLIHKNAYLIKYAALILFFNCMSWIPMALLRLKEKPKLFLGIRLVEVVLTMGLNIYFLIIAGMGVEGIFISTALASFTKFFLFFLTIIKDLKITFKWTSAKQLFLFGLPLMPTGLSISAMQLVNRRLVIERFLGTDQVGLYGAGYKLGKMMMLISTAFYFAWQPFFLHSGVNDESKKLFSRVLTYFTFAALSIWLILTVFIDKIVNIHIGANYLISPDYHASIKLVPYLLLAFVFYGIYQIFLPGIYFKKKTKYIAYNVVIAALVNISGNFLLVPRIGLLGSALGTLLGYIVLAILTYRCSQKLIKINYEYSRVALLFLIFVPIGFITFYSQFDFVLKLIIVLIIPGILLISNFFNKEELNFIKKVLNKGANN